MLLAALATMAVLFVAPSQAQVSQNALAQGNKLAASHNNTLDDGAAAVVVAKSNNVSAQHLAGHAWDTFEIVVICVVIVIVLVGIALTIYLLYSGSTLEKRVKSRKNKRENV